MPDSSNLHSLVDWTKVSFPSDRLPLGEARKRAGGDPEELEVLIYNLVSHEREVADFALALELEPAGTEKKRRGRLLLSANAAELADRYVEMGVARGKQEANQLVKELMGAARVQVSGKAGRGRS